LPVVSAEFEQHFLHLVGPDDIVLPRVCPHYALLERKLDKQVVLHGEDGLPKHFVQQGLFVEAFVQTDLVFVLRKVLAVDVEHNGLVVQLLFVLRQLLRVEALLLEDFTQLLLKLVALFVVDHNELNDLLDHRRVIHFEFLLLHPIFVQRVYHVVQLAHFL